MTIKQQGGIFGRNPSFNNVDVQGDLNISGAFAPDTVSSTNTSDGTTTVDTSYVVNGPARAWVNFNGTGTIAERNSFNVASLTDVGTGSYIVNLTNAMSGSDDYTAAGGSAIGTGVYGLRYVTSGLTASALPVEHRYDNGSSFALTDGGRLFVSIHGELA